MIFKIKYLKIIVLGHCRGDMLPYLKPALRFLRKHKLFLLSMLTLSLSILETTTSSPSPGCKSRATYERDISKCYICLILSWL